MKISVIDTESDGLKEEATVLWVAVSRDLDTDEEIIFEDPKHDFIEHLKQSDIIVMHNALDHDRPVIEKILDYKIPFNKILDTLVLSRFNRPDRRDPGGWTGKSAPHSVEAWGMRFGIPKPGHEDWSVYSPEMLHRCREDTRIQRQILKYLMKEFEGIYGVP